MRITKIEIAPKSSWEPVGERNPLRAVVKLASEQSTVECVLSDESMRRMLDLCAEEIATQAAARVAEFVAAVNTIDGPKSAAMIGGE